MQQYAYFFAPFAAAAGVLTLARLRFATRPVVRLTVAGAVAGLLVLVMALPVIRVHDALGFERLDQLVRLLSARPTDFLTRPETALLGVPPRGLGDTAGLFPGILLLALAFYGMRRGVRDPTRRLWTMYLAGSAVAALLLALGLNLRLADWQPFEIFRTVVPGMDEVRSPFRFAVITQLCMATLGALGLDGIRHLSAPRGAGLALLIGLLAAGENLTVPAPLTTIPSSVRTEWSRWLRAEPDTAVVVHVPFPSGLHVSDYEIETRRMFAQIDHRKPLVNGYSSYFPQAQAPDGTTIPTYTEFQLAMANLFPNYELLCTLNKSLGANILVADRDWLSRHSSDMRTYGEFLQPTYADEQVQIYRLEAPAEECESG